MSTSGDGEEMEGVNGRMEEEEKGSGKRDGG